MSFFIKLSLSTGVSGLLYLSSLSAPVLFSHAAWADGPGYVPPQVGAPSRRVGGGTRGAEAVPLFIAVLAPESIAYTLSAQPTLYWALSEPVSQPIEVLLMETNPASVEDMQPLLEQKLSEKSPGIHKISLSEQGINLKPGVEYEWFVSLLGKERSEDVITSGVLKYVTETARLENQQKPQNITECLAQADKAMPLYQQYFGCGIWYDGLARLSEEIEQGKTDLKAVRRDLMESVALPKVANLDR